MRLEGAPIVEDDGDAGGETGDEPMPHHPGGSRVVEEAVSGPDVALVALTRSYNLETRQSVIERGRGMRAWFLHVEHAPFYAG